MIGKSLAVCVLSVLLVVPSGCRTGPAPQATTVAGPSQTPAGGRRKIAIRVRDTGFVPDKITVAAGEPLTLVFTRQTDKTCLQDVVVSISEKQRIVRPLPVGQAVEIDVAFPQAGELGYACGMSMYGGAIFVK